MCGEDGDFGMEDADGICDIIQTSICNLLLCIGAFMMCKCCWDCCCPSCKKKNTQIEEQQVSYGPYNNPNQQSPNSYGAYNNPNQPYGPYQQQFPQQSGYNNPNQPYGPYQQQFPQQSGLNQSYPNHTNQPPPPYNYSNQPYGPQQQQFPQKSGVNQGYPNNPQLYTYGWKGAS